MVLRERKVASEKMSLWGMIRKMGFFISLGPVKVPNALILFVLGPVVVITTGWLAGGGNFINGFNRGNLIYGPQYLIPFGVQIGLAFIIGGSTFYAVFGIDAISKLKNLFPLTIENFETEKHIRKRVEKQCMIVFITIWVILGLIPFAYFGSQNLHKAKSFDHEITEQYKHEHQIGHVEAKYEGLFPNTTRLGLFPDTTREPHRHRDQIIVYKFTTPDQKHEFIAYKGHKNTVTAHKKISEKELHYMMELEEWTTTPMK